MNIDDIYMDSWDKLSREKLIEDMTKIVEEWIEFKPDELFGKLYRLDILEKDIKVALLSDNPCKNIAVLIIERQYQKFLSRKHFKNPPSNPEDEDILW